MSGMSMLQEVGVRREVAEFPEEVPKSLRKALEGIAVKTLEVRRVTEKDPLLIVNGKVVGGWLDL